MSARAILAMQLALGRAAGLPAPGTSDAKRLAPLLAKPQVDASAPEVRQEQQQVRDVVRQSRRQQRRKQQEARRADKALRVQLPSGVAFDAGAPPPDMRRLDLSLVHPAVRRAKLTAIAKVQSNT
jgi:hypothetical protein